MLALGFSRILSMWQAMMLGTIRIVYSCILIFILSFGVSQSAVSMETAEGENHQFELIEVQQEWARQILRNSGEDPQDLEGNALIARAMQLSLEAGFFLSAGRKFISASHFLVYQANRLAGPLADAIERSNIPAEYYLGATLTLIFMLATNEVIMFVYRYPDEQAAVSHVDMDKETVDSLFNYTLHEMCSSEEAPRQRWIEVEDEILNLDENIPPLLPVEQFPEAAVSSVAVVVTPLPEPDETEPEWIPQTTVDPEPDLTDEMVGVVTSTSGHVRPTPTVKIPVVTVKAEPRTWGQLGRSILVGTVFLAAEIPCIAYEISNCLVRNGVAKAGKKVRKKKSRNGIEYKKRALFWGVCTLGGGTLATVTDASVDTLVYWWNNKGKTVRVNNKPSPPPEKPPEVVDTRNLTFIGRNFNNGMIGYGCELEVLSVYSFSLSAVAGIQNALTSYRVSEPNNLHRALCLILATVYYPTCRVETDFNYKDPCTLFGMITFIASLTGTAVQTPWVAYTYKNPLAATFYAFFVANGCRLARYFKLLNFYVKKK